MDLWAMAGVSRPLAAVGLVVAVVVAVLVARLTFRRHDRHQRVGIDLGNRG